jgi:Domain of unknown function (DUF1707)
VDSVDTPARETTARRQLRVSDAERDAVVTELGEHFQAGRLDAAELDDRTGRALRARTGGDLDEVLADLPRASGPGASGGPRAAARSRLPLIPFLVPVLIAAALVAGSLAAGTAAGGGHHAWAAGVWWWPVWWLIPLVALRLVWLERRLGGARRWR